RFQIASDNTVTENRYDSFGNILQQIRYAKPVVGTWTDESSLKALLQADAQDRSSRSLYDTANRLRYSVDALGYVSERVYDAVGNVVQVTDYAQPVANGWTDEASLRALLKADAGQDRSRFTVYDSANRGRYQIDALGYVTVNHYDNLGRLIGLTRHAKPISRPATLTLDSLAQAIVADAANDRSQYTVFDAMGKPRYEIDAEGYVSETRYDAFGREIERIRYQERISIGLGNLDEASVQGKLQAGWPGNVSIRTGYDQAGRVTQVIDGEGIVTRTEYDAFGRKQRVIVGEGRADASATRYQYDNRDLLLAETRGDGTAAASTVRYEYDAFGNRTAMIDPIGVALLTSDAQWAKAERQQRGKPIEAAQLRPSDQADLLKLYTTQYRYDQNNRRIATIDALGQTSQVSYTAFGEEAKLTDARGFVTWHHYDANGRRRFSIDAERQVSETRYNAFDDVIEQIRYDQRAQGELSRGVQILNGNEPPPADRAWLRANAAFDDRQQTEWDRLGRRLGTLDAEGRYDGALDNQGQHARDAFGQASQSVNRAGGITRYQYDRLGRLTEETQAARAQNSAGQSVDVINRYQYDSLGNRTRSIEAHGLPEQRITDYRYDKVGRQTHQIREAFATFDAGSGQRGTVTPVDVTRYDAAGRVIEQIKQGHWQNDQVTGGARTVCWYDAIGNKLAQVDPMGAMTSWEYNLSGQPIYQLRHDSTVTVGPRDATTAIPQPTVRASDRAERYRYDTLGRRTDTIVDNQLIHDTSDPSKAGETRAQNLETHLVYDASGNVIEERDARGNSTYHWYDSLGRKILSVDREGYLTSWDHHYRETPSDPDNLRRLETRHARKHPGPVAGKTAAEILANRIADPINDRVTVTTLDRQGRVKEVRIRGVEFDRIVDTNTGTSTLTPGSGRGAQADAITRYTYDGLGNVTQISQLASTSNQGEVWETTDLTLDNWGRETRRLAPGYQSGSQFLRPQTDTRYDGLGHIQQLIQRGLNQADRVATYRYIGDRLVELQATDRATERYEHDALGHTSRKTLVDVQDADGNRSQLITEYQNDQLGRVIRQRDVGTGEVRRVQYNSFGEISGKALGDGEWQERIAYNRQGKIWKSNSQGGVTKLYQYDQNGNVTRELSSIGQNLDTVASETDLAQLNDVIYRISRYDKRDQLTETIDPRMDMTETQSQVNSLYKQVWQKELFGDINSTPSSNTPLKANPPSVPTTLL
ncbi:YD repeat-containing protein, partial [Chitinivorax tropicus]|nr:YD repeat-containing protein [Chitinivorax tropicus]